MTKEQFIASFEARVQIEADKMSVAGDAPEAFHCAAVAQLFFECLKDAEIGLLDFEPCSYYAEATPGQGEVSMNGYYLSEDNSELHLFAVVKADAVGAKVSSTDIRAAFDKAFRFYKRAVAKTETPFHDQLDEALAPYASASRRNESNDRNKARRSASRSMLMPFKVMSSFTLPKGMNGPCPTPKKLFLP